MIYNRIHHFHIRKTAGRAINDVFDRSELKGIYTHSHEMFKIFDEHVFTFTCFRDPISRVVSHFRMLKQMIAENSTHPCMKTERPWAEGTLNDFLDRAPKRDILRQLFMFSGPSYDLDQAVCNIKSLNAYIFQRDLENGITTLTFLLRNQLNYHLPFPRKVGVTKYQYEPTKAEWKRLREMMQPEHELFERLMGD